MWAQPRRHPQPLKLAKSRHESLDAHEQVLGAVRQVRLAHLGQEFPRQRDSACILKLTPPGNECAREIERLDGMFTADKEGCLQYVVPIFSRVNKQGSRCHITDATLKVSSHTTRDPEHVKHWRAVDKAQDITHHDRSPSWDVATGSDDTDACLLLARRVAIHEQFQHWMIKKVHKHRRNWSQ